MDFDHVGDGLNAKDGRALRHFALAGEDGVFVWANAEIKNNQVIVWHDQISKPKHLRYAWADNPEQANLYNKNGLPAAPFKIDFE
ncbi:Sialic acid-specific 9-O-acetylesterase [Indibacter alkaliphilus LW1]|uniref:Sialic acid-specific 9-O-acetylesterase n=1 Tax=Indibacter alkaliphilus (strain CCUG 57479 / KCTC 22604 / LW1) TaxID=1189612 RepID=S2DNH6_INDAL|nr:hypothetical protein [Indibacter alkaliphilus]EOZ98780.1 Sialic acid-specific 9-O-acetylesterase [Indibacter alkaliphilus LW1]